MNNQPVGTIIIPREITIEEQAINLLDKFNIRLVFVSLALTVVLTLIFTARALLRRNNKLSIEEALRFGESKSVEFKSTFQWDIKLKKHNDDLRLNTLKSIAGFLNSEGGTLFIGVQEDESGKPSIRGLKEDIKLAHESKDKLQRILNDLITERIGPQFSPFITDRIKETQNECYWEVAVEQSPTPAFVRWKAPGDAKEQKHFYVREGPKTSDLDNERTYLYIKNKWG